MFAHWQIIYPSTPWFRLALDSRTCLRVPVEPVPVLPPLQGRATSTTSAATRRAMPRLPAATRRGSRVHVRVRRRRGSASARARSRPATGRCHARRHGPTERARDAVGPVGPVNGVRQRHAARAHAVAIELRERLTIVAHDGHALPAERHATHATSVWADQNALTDGATGDARAPDRQRRSERHRSVSRRELEECRGSSQLRSWGHENLVSQPALARIKRVWSFPSPSENCNLKCTSRGIVWYRARKVRVTGSASRDSTGCSSQALLPSAT